MTVRRLARFSVVSSLGTLVQLLTFRLANEALGIHYLAATTVAVSAAVLHNFLWHQRWTWADRAASGLGAVRAFWRFAMANGVVSLAGNIVGMALLVGAARFRPLTASVVAIGLCGLANFWLAGRVSFPTRGTPKRTAVHARRG